MVQEITTKSWGSRLMGALLGTLIGLALIIGSFILVFWNEGHGLHTAQSLKETLQKLIIVPNAPINPKNNLKVVYFNGIATTNDILQDQELGISLKAIKLDRKVEIYQWMEHIETRTEKQYGGSEKEIKTYSYKPTWSEGIIDSSQFKDPSGHQNPTVMPIQSMHQQAQEVTVGDYFLSPDLITDINESKQVNLSGINLSALGNRLNKPVAVDGQGLYAGANPQTPEIGDLKISLYEVPPQFVSIIAQQTSNTLQPYLAPAGQPVSLLAIGKLSPQQIIYEAQSENKKTTWLLRFVSLLMMIFGFVLLMRPLVILADVIPFFGSILEFGTGLIAVVIGLILWSIAVAIAWFTVRPLWAIGLIILVVIIIFGLLKLRKRGST